MAVAFWANVPPGEVIHFTDGGWSNGAPGEIRGGENFASWTAPGGGLPAGSVVVFQFPSGSGIVDAGSLVGQLDGLSASGDQILAYQGPSNAPSLLFVFDMNGANTGFEAAGTAIDPNQSMLPTDLTATGHHLAVSHIDNGQYTGPRTGSVAALRLAVLDTNLWTFNNDGALFGNLDSTDFTLPVARRRR
jgi:hypothetical protein